jgi:hypothetical protein
LYAAATSPTIDSNWLQLTTGQREASKNDRKYGGWIKRKKKPNIGGKQQQQLQQGGKRQRNGNEAEDTQKTTGNRGCERRGGQ